MYGSILVGILAMFFRPEARAALTASNEAADYVPLITLALLQGALVVLIWLTARRQKNWARWLLLILFLLGVPFALPGYIVIFRVSFAWGAIHLAASALRAAAYYFIFTGDARDWFRRKQDAAETVAANFS